jgi:hypothetical protein
LNKTVKETVLPLFELATAIAAPRLTHSIYNDVSHSDGVLPLNEFKKDDVFIVGFPRSGHTWMQNIVVALLYGIVPEITPETVTDFLVPNIYRRQYYQRYASTMYFKSHELPSQEYRRVIYVVRDGRDAMVSYYHYLRNTGANTLDFLKMVKDGEGLFRGKWADHVNAWSKNPYQSEMLIVRYQDLKYHTSCELQRICAFMGIERDDDYLANIAEAVSFQHLKKSQEAFWHTDQTDQHFFRHGQVGSYKDEMPPEVLEAFMEESGAILDKYGFLDETMAYSPLESL